MQLSSLGLEPGTLALRDALANGTLSAVALARACLARIEAREPEVRAWAWLDAAQVLSEAERLDAARQAGGPIGPLHGLPVGLKDIIDTAAIPTENGCPLDAGRVPEADAEVVRRLKQAGALIMGKTVTTELAFLHPSKTRNPHNTGHTPGGSSAGSAAAVADGMIPLALGTQTGGSVIRPASFCGVTGFKPSFGAIPREGVCMQSHSLDTLGVFAADPEGAALIADVLMGVGGAVSAAAQAPPVRPRFGVIQPPGWARADPAMTEAFTRFCDGLGAQAVAVDLPEMVEDAARHRATINGAEMAHYYARYMALDPARLGPETRDGIETGQAVTTADYVAALAYREALAPALAPLFAHVDAVLSPAALGPAPAGLGSTGDAIFNGIWTLAGTPAITLPLFKAPSGMPMGLQVIGPVGGDAALAALATWLWRRGTTSPHGPL
jgi:Asp-tRNA(Asn)/Glu-tRNA(Gln) amidotransferase A subunit family amidase